MYYYKEECNLNETASKLHKISPKTIKMVMSGTGNSFKVDMLEALKKQYSEKLWDENQTGGRKHL